ncbi:MAG: hypothetical protein IT463_01940 [Planctomycetes bacterium]|nr:hypothetical protein [Planctomycetota bacterium]
MAVSNCPACGLPNAVPPGHNLPTVTCGQCGATYGLFSGVLVSGPGAPPSAAPQGWQAAPQQPFPPYFAPPQPGAPLPRYIPPAPGRQPPPGQGGPVQAGYPAQPGQMPHAHGYAAPHPWALRAGPPRMPIGTNVESGRNAGLVAALLVGGIVLVVAIAVFAAATGSSSDSTPAPTSDPVQPLRGQTDTSVPDPNKPTTYTSRRWGFEIVFPVAPTVDASAVSTSVTAVRRGVVYRVEAEDHTRDGRELPEAGVTAREKADPSMPAAGNNARFTVAGPHEVSDRTGYRATYAPFKGFCRTVLVVLDNGYRYVVTCDGHTEDQRDLEPFLASFKLLRPKDDPATLPGKDALRLLYVGNETIYPEQEYVGTLVALGGVAGEPVQWEILESRLPKGLTVITEERRLLVRGTPTVARQKAFLRVQATVGDETAVLEVTLSPPK